jgi:hypothetical protein
MVEILMLGSFTNHVGAVAQHKGYRPGNYRLMALILWCLGELIGLFCGLVLVPPSDPLSLFTVYMCALAGAGAGAAMAYSIVRGLKPDLAKAV